MNKKALLIWAALAVAVLFVAGCERKVVVEDDDQTSLASCFTCHGDQEFAMLAAKNQWERSQHASGENADRNRNYDPVRYQSCEKCHTNEGFIAELTGTPYPGGEFSVIGCFTCHAPHTNGNLDLRTTAATALKNGDSYDRSESNICARCHQARENATTYIVDGVRLTTRWGPHHSNQADMLIGSNAYEYEGFTYRNSAHTNAAADGCLNCHMAPGISNMVGGHTFRMYDEDSQHILVSGCNTATCHNSAVSSSFNITADEDYDWDGNTEGVEDEITGLLDSLFVLLRAGNLITTSGSPVNNRVVALAESAGAVYNYLFVEEDRSNGIHNTEYAAGLLQSSINYLATGDPNGLFRRPGIGKLTMAAAH